MTIKHLYKLFIIILVLQSCDSSNCCQPADLNNIVGQYQVFEYGYSPGDRYIVEDVPAEPAQLLEFTWPGTFSSNYQQLTEYNFYRVYDHPTEGKILALYKDEPPASPGDLARLEHSYIMQIEEGKLKLIYRYCREGCHIGIRKLN